MNSYISISDLSMEETILYSPDFPNYSNMPSQLIRQIFCTNQYKPSMEIKEFSQAELELTYKKILKAIVSELNTYHQINLSEKQWETIIGYWLLNFLTGAKDRWTTIEKIERNSLEKTVLIREVPLNFSRNVSHMNDSQLSESSSFNDAIFSQILEYFPDIKIRKLESSFHSPLEKSRPHKKYRFRSRVAWIKNMTSEFIQISARKLTRYKFHKKIFLVDNWVPLNGIFRLSLMCHFPVFNNSNIFHDIEFPGPVLLDRRIHLTRLKAENRFEIFLKDHIVEYFPTSILESFKFQKLRLDKLGLNFTPLMTISDLQHTGGSDLARIWFGLYGNSDSQLVVMQHGGTYGQYRWQSSAYFERRICSKFLSWGWVEQTLEVNQILDIPAIRLMSTRNLDNENHNNKILFLLCPEQHYLSVKLSGQPSDANEFIVYIARIQKIQESLLRLGGRELVILPQSKSSRLISSILTIDLNQQEIDQLKVSNFNHAEILVSTYNGTNSLECLLTGRPTIFYWQPEYADYSEIMAPVIKKLREAGVLIEECETLVETLLMESTEIIRWWTTTKVQLAVREYLSLFGNIDGGIARWSGKITDLYMTEYRKDQKPYE